MLHNIISIEPVKHDADVYTKLNERSEICDMQVDKFFPKMESASSSVICLRYLV